MTFLYDQMKDGDTVAILKDGACPSLDECVRTLTKMWEANEWRVSVKDGAKCLTLSIRLPIKMQDEEGYYEKV